MKLWQVLSLAVCGLGIGTAGVLAAGAPQGMESVKAFREMQQNITWTVEGLQQLGKSPDRALTLTKPQAQKLLPVYQELIAKKIIRIEAGKREEKRPDFRPSGQGEQGDPRFQKREKAMVALTGFGKAKMDQINRILTARQRSFIDNLDFQPEQYGYFKMQGPPAGIGSGNRSGNGTFSGQSQDGQRSRAERSGRRELDPKQKAAREQLVKLNREVLEMLKRLQ